MSIHDFDEGTQALMREIAKLAAKDALSEHWANCPVHDLKIAVFGNGRPGLKTEMIEVKQELATLRESRTQRNGFASTVMAAVLASSVVGVVMWLLQMFAVHAK